MIFNMVEGGVRSELNFTIVGGTTQPSSPSANTIWVNTNVGITNWHIGNYSNPTWAGTEGQVLIHAETSKGTSTANAFNAIKNGNLWVAPLVAHQYVNGAWVEKTAKIYQDGKWNDLVYELYLYNNGTFSSQGGNLKQSGVKYGGSAGSCTLKNNTSNVTIGTYGNSGALVYFTNQIDLTDFSTLYFNGSVVDKNSASASEKCGIGVWKSLPTSNAGTEASAIMEGFRAAGTHQLNINNCTGKHYVGIAVHGLGEASNPYLLVTMNQLWLK
jgi:hypothetical protein